MGPAGYTRGGRVDLLSVLRFIPIGVFDDATVRTIGRALFGVPLTGSFLTLALGALLFVTTTTTTAYGMLISTFASTQIAALFGTAILTVLPATQFSGMMVPVSALSGTAQIMGRAFPKGFTGRPYFRRSVFCLGKEMIENGVVRQPPRPNPRVTA